MSDYRLIQGDAVSVLGTLEAGSVQTCITSPPYFGLRDYGTALWAGGDPACDHVSRRDAPRSARPRGGLTSGMAYNDARDAGIDAYRYVCACCGAARVDQQIGLEATPAEYVARLVEVFRAVRKVLRDDGTVFLNLGDSFAGGGGSGANNNGKGSSSMGWPGQNPATLNKAAGMKLPPVHHGLPAKNLLGIPWRVAFALQDDGWILRSDIIWAKTAPMPESVTDRPTRSHEYIFLLAKNPRYYYDADAIREPHSIVSVARVARTHHTAGHKWEDGPGGHTLHNDLSSPLHPSGRNKRTVWTDIGPEPLSDAHFAAFPTRLPELCLLAGSSAVGCCSDCGTPWRRVVDRESRPNIPSLTCKYNGADKHRTVSGGVGQDRRHRIPKGWEPTCACAAETVPCTILDPFCGSGSTGIAALRNGRDFIGIDLSADYLKLAARRIEASLHQSNVLDRPRIPLVAGQQPLFDTQEAG